MTVSREARTEAWRTHVDTWQASGQSQRAFCQDHALNYAQFTYWRRKFQATKPTAEASSGFVPVRYASPSSDQGLVIALANGVELRGVSRENLAVVAQLLTRLS